MELSFQRTRAPTKGSIWVSNSVLEILDLLYQRSKVSVISEMVDSETMGSELFVCSADPVELHPAANTLNARVPMI